MLCRMAWRAFKLPTFMCNLYILCMRRISTYVLMFGVRAKATVNQTYHLCTVAYNLLKWQGNCNFKTRNTSHVEWDLRHYIDLFTFSCLFTFYIVNLEYCFWQNTIYKYANRCQFQHVNLKLDLPSIFSSFSFNLVQRNISEMIYFTKD